MKKSKLSITLVTGFIAAMALSACSNVTSDKKAIATFTPYGSKEKIALLTDDVYNAYNGTTNGISKFYDKILEVLIRYEFKEKGFKGEMNYDEIEKWAKNQVKEQKEQADKNAKNNGTSYDTEWKSILESKNVEDEKGLREYFIYDKEKTVMQNWFADEYTAEGLKEEFLGLNAQGASTEKDVRSAMPYHIRHILVNVEEASAAEKFYKGTVTEEQAKKLFDIVQTLAKGEKTFTETALKSEDTSNEKGGDVGIVTNVASSVGQTMVNEFRLGLYAYDNIYDAANAADPAAAIIKKGLGITNDVKDALPANVVEVPYEAFVNLGKYAEVTADANNNKLAGGSTALYPRNIIWNKYFNLHNVFVIKNAKKADYSALANPRDEFDNLASDTVYDASLPRFNAQGYLVDEKGNVIVGVRSQYGIHFMVIEESMYDYAEFATYYDTKLPGEEGYNENARSYVNYIQSSDIADYKTRADDILNKVKGFDKTYDYRLYNYLKTQVTIEFKDAADGLGNKIDSYIKAQQENNNYKQDEGLAEDWRTYTEMLELQENNRDAQYTTKNAITGDDSPVLTRLVPEKIADDFYKLNKNPAPLSDPTYIKFTEEGDYYYYA